MQANPTNQAHFGLIALLTVNQVSLLGLLGLGCSVVAGKASPQVRQTTTSASSALIGQLGLGCSG